MNKLPSINRRRAITITAAAAGMAVLPANAAPAGNAAATPERAFRWTGTALGGAAEIQLFHPERNAARRIVSDCITEIERLENQFSLYRADSALTRLNRDGHLDRPSHDMVKLLSACADISSRTKGAFDITSGVLWNLYARHFHNPHANPSGPDLDAVNTALNKIDYTAVGVRPHEITLGTPGMILTLNGIAQGYITDRVTEILRRNGLTNVLVNLGEVRALGHRDNNRSPWRVAIQHNPALSEQESVIDLSNGAVATSAGAGTVFESAGEHHHLFDPSTGRSANRYTGISVIAPTATTADGLSTAFYAMPEDAIRRTLSNTTRVKVIATRANGSPMTYNHKEA